MKKRTQKGSGLEHTKRRKQDATHEAINNMLGDGGVGKKSSMGKYQINMTQSKGRTTTEETSKVGTASASRVLFSLLSGKVQLTHEASVPGEVDVQNDNRSLGTAPICVESGMR